MSDPLAAVSALPGVADALAEARSAVDRLLGQRVLRGGGAVVSAESAVRGARASAALEGASVDLGEVRAGTARDPAVRGALRVSVEVDRLAATWSRAPRQVLARLHTLAAADAVEADGLGRPRTGLDVRDPLGLGAPPAPAEAAARLAAVAELLVSGTEAPAIVVAGVVHGELLAVRPFGWGDGIVARAAQRLTLIDRGLDPKAVTVPEVGHLELATAYATALRGYLGGTRDGLAEWLVHCARALTLGAREGLAICTAMARR